LNTKGGVGKSSFTVCASLLLNKKVLIVDLCENSDVATRLGYDRKQFRYSSVDVLLGNCSYEEALEKHSNNLHFIPGSNQAKHLMEQLKKSYGSRALLRLNEVLPRESYDVIFIDNPGSEDDRIYLSLFASNLALLFTKVDTSDFEGALHALEYIKKVQLQGKSIKTYLIPSVVENGLKKELRQVLSRHFPDVAYTHSIRSTIAYKRMGLYNQTIIDPEVLNKPSIRKLRTDYQLVLQEIGLC
jgi:cellulose biosynthesis protein BcsQ